MLSGMYHRIYFDGNDAAEDGAYLLSLRKSKEGLAQIPGGPREGMVVTIYMIGEIEAEATPQWCGEPWNCWTAQAIKGTFRPNNETWE
jgi:hypothetical protein